MTVKENIFEYTQGIMDLGANSMHGHGGRVVSNVQLRKIVAVLTWFLPINQNVVQPQILRKLHFVLLMSDKGFLMQKIGSRILESLWIPLSKDLIGNIPVNASVDLHHKLVSPSSSRSK